MTTNNIPLVSSEIAGIWNSYMGETLFSCILKHYVNRVDDKDIHTILQSCLDLSNQRISKLEEYFKQEGIAVPEGFTDSDVDTNAPRLFTDALYLQYANYVSKIAMRDYSLILNTVYRTDIREFFSRSILESIDIFNKSLDLSLSKGICSKAPRIEITKEVNYIKNDSFMMEWFGEKRPLLAEELNHIYCMANNTMIRRSLLIGFSQVCKSKKVSNYLSKILDVSEKQNNDLIKILSNEGISIPESPETYVTASTISPFSEKLILNKALFMYRVKIGSLGLALADVKRSDLSSLLEKHFEECLKCAKDASAILIENGWFEQPPQTIKHEHLVGV